jgi:hypothetical protein
MPIPETQLGTWAHHGATGPSKDTYAEIKSVLEDAASRYPTPDCTVFLQGSYWNDTNVWGVDSDVDVVIRLDNVYYSDLQYLPPEDTTRYNNAFSAAAYDLPEFKTDVVQWLTRKFGNVQPGTKAIFIPGSNTRRDADVLVCTEFRRYHNFQNEFTNSHEKGIFFITSNGTRIDNFPKQHAENCSAKHQATNSRFKPTVRIFKNIRNKLVRDGVIREGVAPSYHLEGLLYNVANSKFAGSHSYTVEQCLNEVWFADRTKYVAANELYYLLWNNSVVCWNEADCNTFLNAAIGLWNDW